MGLLSALASTLLNPSKENSRRYRGASGEAQTALGLFLRLPSEYKVFHNVLLRTPKGTTQIDHIAVSKYGLFVIETKNMQGDIYGSSEQKTWTVCLGTHKFPIYNPLWQNAGHISALAEVTTLPESVFHSLVFFWDLRCRFRTPMPDNVRQTGLTGYIRSKRKQLLRSSDVTMAIRLIEARRLPDTKEYEEKHIANQKARFSAPIAKETTKRTGL